MQQDWNVKVDVTSISFSQGDGTITDQDQRHKNRLTGEAVKFCCELHAAEVEIVAQLPARRSDHLESKFLGLVAAFPPYKSSGEP